MKHHYIPQFYLRPWLGPDHKLQEFRRGYQGRIQTGRYGTESTGFEKDLYVLPGASEETKQNIEKQFMSVVDNEAVTARNMMLSGVIPRDPALRHSWARFVVSLIFRNPEELGKFKDDFRRRLLTPSPEFTARYEAAKAPDDPETMEEWISRRQPDRVERESIMAVARLIEHQNVLALLRTMDWRVVDTSRVTRRLMTSDRPVVMTGGMNRYDGHFGIPISPTRLFIAFTVSSYANRFCAASIGKIVRTVNEVVIGQARKYVYSVDASNAAEVRRRMGKLAAPSLIDNMARDLDDEQQRLKMNK